MMIADVVYDSQTGFNCAVPSYLGPLFIVIGTLALFWGAVAWDLRLPKVLRSIIVAFAPADIDQPSTNRNVVRFLGPFNGTAFVLAGAYIVWGKMHCGTWNLALPNIVGPIAFSDWPGVYVATVVAAAFTFWNTRGEENLPMRLVAIAWMAFTGFATGEAAGFHTGIHAMQWGVAAFSSFALMQLVGWALAWLEKQNSGDGNRTRDSRL